MRLESSVMCVAYSYICAGVCQDMALDGLLLASNLLLV